ncbi:MAG TPA: co-chaperone GroES [Anaerolineaceae bacterium]|jgi:chaperonin GroES|nr:co-chaperone GroES [Anaerolineaceae bacterium]HNZ15267.1 co-chaperone GroES [Anaerolineaceae bacterium]HOH91992.1 co-chaperone GroES [Anaerolineaceae bacterium]HPX65387.1 co-chaperone GroES [Anaerolineaceae bacterium]HQC64726.1 co-chaperone GroES [Anaerolineaceae bacterium]
MTIKMRPLGSRLVIEPIEQEDITAGGIVLPETAKEKPQKGTVLAIGPGERNDAGERIPMDVKVGEVVLYAKYSGTEIKYDGKKLLILRESDVLAIL